MPRSWTEAGLMPPQASSVAPQVDQLYAVLVALTVFFGVLISGLIFVFAIRYHRTRPGQVGAAIRGGLALEVIWSVVPLVIVMAIFVWSSSIFVAMADPPRGALDVYVVGKQWMWKVQHASGQREINTLHVPADTDVRLILASEDVIHDFYVPAFRLKTDVVPGKYTTLWFRATRPGSYHLFCAEYCGTNHAGMGGRVIVQTPLEFEGWLAGGRGAEAPAEAGRRLFDTLACNGCHRAGTAQRGPALEGVFGSTVTLASGAQLTADEAYVRESILRPRAQIVAGYPPIMPAFQGLVTEEQLLQLVEYVKSLGVGALPEGRQ